MGNELTRGCGAIKAPEGGGSRSPDPLQREPPLAGAFLVGAGPGGRMKAGADVCGEGGRPDAEGLA